MATHRSQRPRIGRVSQSRSPVQLAVIATALCALACVAVGQTLEATIMLPDTLGPLNGPYHLAWDDNPDHPRLYVGGEADSGGVIVAEAITCKRLARIPTGPVKSLYFVPLHRKLYVASLISNTIEVVDGATNQIASTISVPGVVPVMQYNSVNDRLYCGGNSVSVIDCTSDTVMNTIPVSATVFALDSGRNRLYAGSSGPLSVIDCERDSVVAAISGVDSAGALCFNPTAAKIYATSGDTLFAVSAPGDSLVARVGLYGPLVPMLACDPDRSRIYCAAQNYWWSIDCTADTVLLDVYTGSPVSWGCDVSRDRLYMTFSATHTAVFVYDASNGSVLAEITVNGMPSGMEWCPGLDRVYTLPQIDTAHHYQSCLLTAVDCAAESVAGIAPFTMWAGQITVDTVHNRLYFVYQTMGVGCVGAVDCSRNIVTRYWYAGVWTTAVCYNPNNDRLYWAECTEDPTYSVVTVFDCTAESVVKRIPIGDEILSLGLHEGLNKLCVYTRECAVSIIDCSRDTLVAHIPLASDYPRPILLVPEDNRFWYLGVRDVVVVDLVGDTVVARVVDTLTSLDDACACPKDRKIYTSDGQVIQMDNPGHVDSIPFYAARFCYVPGSHKLYGVSNYRRVQPPPPGYSVFRVLDTWSDTVTTTFEGPSQVSGMCLDHTGNYIYCAGYGDSLMFVIDVRGDSVISALRVPTTAAARDPLAVNRRTNRIYEASYSNRSSRGIPVVRDSMLIGLEELRREVLPTVVEPTFVRRNAPLQVQTLTSVFDASGRRLTVLQAGRADISQFRPGVYFIRTTDGESAAAGARKLIILQ